MRLFVLIFSSAKLISFRVWCIFFQINRHAAVENNAHFFRVGHMYESSLFLPNFSAHLLNFTISQVTRTQNRKLAVKVTRSLHSLFSLEFRRLAAQGEARSVLTKGYIGDVLTETAKDLKRGWRFRTSSESEITDCHALLLINSLLNYVQKKKKRRRRCHLAPFLYNSYRWGMKTNTNVYREPQKNVSRQHTLHFEVSTDRPQVLNTC